MHRILLIALLPLLSGGCIRTVASIVTVPVKVVSKGVGWATTSQSEADRNYGRKMRKDEAREGKERRKWLEDCRRNPDCSPYDGFRAGR